ncbi:MAG: hypothetical protein A2161_02700 [Candidatus Schekmanbacteria bacterium RBG_13_48_7]|uniref:Methyltransferase type 11 domain-containing protein n=1 Tax=Candidatus Schekmanbacteria bacterium RBG_13_48_7 TaxID=1817878 RepID=A0A1F7S2V6_9BACT|nr:MAG: hypothetical protein A2161_02700 [Candidatus Schekmanbacteria bacterium RBG_13_48_7]
MSISMLRRAQKKCRKIKNAQRPVFITGDYAYNPAPKLLVDKISFSYSLSMIHDYRKSLEQAYNNLKPGGIIGIIDFLDSKNRIIKKWLLWHNVRLGHEQLHYINKLFNETTYIETNYGLWRIYEYFGEKTH